MYRPALALALAFTATFTLACGGGGADTTETTDTTDTDPPATTTEGDGDGDGEPAGCQRLEGEQPDWALRCGGPASERVIGFGVGESGDLLLGFELRTLDPLEPAPLQIGQFIVDAGELSDIVLLALDGAGEPRWVRHFGGPGDQFLSSAAVCRDGLAVTGTTQNGVVDLGEGPIEGQFVAVFDGEGELVWSRTGELGATLASVCDSAGDLLMTGRMREGVDFGGGLLVPNQLFDGFLVRYGPTGEHRLSRLLGNIDSSNISGSALALTPGGGAVVVGSFDRTVDFGGGPMTAEFGDDVLIVNYDAEGNYLWSRQFGPGGLQYGRAVAVADDGTIAVGGLFLDTLEIGADTYQNVFPDHEDELHGTLYDGFIALLDPQGTPTWSTTIASMLNDDIHSVDFDAAGALVVGAVQEQRAVVRVFEAGAETWAWSSEPGGWSWPRYGVTRGGSVVLASSIEGAIELGSGPLVGDGGVDVLVTRLAR